MALFQTNLDECRIHGRVRCVDRGKISGDAYVGDDHTEIGRGNDVPYNILNFCDVFITNLDARTTWHFHVHDELPRIGARKISAAKKWHK